MTELASRSIPVMSTFVYINYFDFQDPYTASAAATILLLMIVAFVAARHWQTNCEISLTR